MAWSPERAAPQRDRRQPRDRARALLRPRLRLRHHAGLAPPAQAPDLEGAARSTVCLLVVWWAWNYTTWFTNELDPTAIAVRVVVIGLMLGSLLLAIAIPEAFGAHGLLFAGAYVAMQVGRQSFLFVASERGTMEARRSGRILIWFLAAGALWLAGGVAEDGARWCFGSPRSGSTTSHRSSASPRAGPAPLGLDAWEVETSHFAERFQLFVIIALGEVDRDHRRDDERGELDTAVLVAFALAFLATAAFW